MRGARFLQSLLALGVPTHNDNDRPPNQITHIGIPLRILTHNIRYATSSPEKNEKPWKDRFPLIANELSYHTRHHDGTHTPHGAASFICLQEVLHNQLDDILSGLNHVNTSDSTSSLPSGPLWAHIGVAREDGKTKGEYSPILYPPKLFDLLHFENMWLSETPDGPSKGWDAGSERILTTGVFEHKFTKQRLAVFNTHLDNVGSESRRKSVGLILKTIERIRRKWVPLSNDISPREERGLDFFLAGDFNSFPTQEAYEAVIASDTMVDAHDMLLLRARYGDEITFTGFQPDTDEDEDAIGRIDFIFFGPKSAVDGGGLEKANVSQRGWRVEGYSVLPNVFDSGVFSSDHRSVVADALLES